MPAKEQTFGERNFGHAELGDVRRTKRLVRLADQLVHRPSGSLPEKINSPNELKATYRLFDNPQVTHEAVMDSHQQHLFNEVLPEQSGYTCLLYTSPSPRDQRGSRMPSSA